ncbi:glycosyl hydrolase family 8 [Sphingobium sp. TCM1]|uniref:glycosyl hydrolase family 8 n=1 Tax=Sphingobium sp. TCM1 TaxID=453246 RepID=UPI0007F52001|nr:glycosyl hydrolase family 8 [Sphingobium sp. TCM1]OAN58905.1 endoglucanase [Sphingobium sp. TCM1]
MVIDRRSFALGALAVMTGSCARAGSPRSRSGRSSSPAAKALWAQFKARFLDPSGRIVDTGNNNVSHSEGQGYGLWLAQMADDKTAFTSMFEWTEKTLARPDLALYAWRYDPRQTDKVADRNNATDGDIFIAWALARAGEQWKEPLFTSRSEEIRAAILTHLVTERFGRRLLLPGLDGFSTPNKVTVNPSYLVWPAFDKFLSLDGRGVWGPLVTDSEKLLLDARFGPNRLPTDWVDVTADAALAPAAGKPPRFGFDAVRVPLYAMAGGRRTLADPVISFWRQYARLGKTIPAWIDVQSGQLAEYPLSAGGMAVVDRSLDRATTPAMPTDYYSAALQSLSKAL